MAGLGENHLEDVVEPLKQRSLSAENPRVAAELLWLANSGASRRREEREKVLYCPRKCRGGGTQGRTKKARRWTRWNYRNRHRDQLVYKGGLGTPIRFSSDKKSTRVG